MNTKPFFWMLVITMGILCSVAAENDTRKDPLKGGLYLMKNIDKYRLMVKFRPALDPDIDNDGNLMLFYKRAPSAVTSMINKYNIKFTRVMEYPEKDLQILRTPQRHIPDEYGYNRYEWAGLLYVHTPDSSKEKLLEIAVEFEKLDEIEYASLDADSLPPAGAMTDNYTPTFEDYPPVSENLVQYQTYRGPNPGFDADYANKLGYNGQGICIGDAEHSWGKLDHANKQVHEDLHNQNIKYGLPWTTDDYQTHGISVMGLLMAAENGFGMTGTCSKSRGLVYSWFKHGDVKAIASANDSLKPGDVMLLEMQRFGGRDGVLAPPDVPKANWDAVKQGTDKGIIYVLTAGNSGENLDASQFSEYMARGDNGAIIEGAGSANTSHTKLGFSPYGKRIDCHGWGEKVATLAYGSSWKKFGGDNNQSYTNSFSGTSSGGPCVTSAAVLISCYAKEKFKKILKSSEVRDIIKKTGIPSGTTNVPFGPLPNIKAAFEWMDKNYPTYLEDYKINKVKNMGLVQENGVIKYFVPNTMGGKAGVKISVYDLKGVSHGILLDEQKAPGVYTIAAKSILYLAPGIYVCQMKVQDVKNSIRFIVK